MNTKKQGEERRNKLTGETKQMNTKTDKSKQINTK